MGMTNCNNCGANVSEGSPCSYCGTEKSRVHVPEKIEHQEHTVNYGNYHDEESYGGCCGLIFAVIVIEGILGYIGYMDYGSWEGAWKYMLLPITFIWDLF